ncbi:MAG: polysaccharide biosynthesis C-terminal domain-containing protein [Prosthecobacter sp.]|uniref:lipopolysaccharide biosynthesis protein n=1 Tax=Prosthecobacter sp. TaxID=1965333 RepID=UPI001A0DE2AA|nr:polysaccharide biosynthesis C-terminal domain-containing protein [Prosthecobacter sp.]MBE2286888.1 polysaccharide biosynthesis C-terminal domain-containing protein [Prosthecobacter sp.]
MSATRSIFFGATASWFSRGVTILLGLVLLPVLFRTLPKEELGVWLLLGQTWASFGILDLGFGVTLTRHIAFAKGKSGSDPNTRLTASTLQEIADLLSTGCRIYRVLSVVSLLLAFTLGAFYLRTLTLIDVPAVSVWSAWTILCVSFALNIWATPWTCLLQGVGYVGWDALLNSFVNALTLVGQIIAALLGGGLVSLAIIAVAGALAQRFVFFAFARRNRPELFHLKGTWQADAFRHMCPLALRAWVTAVGGSLILYTDQFVIASLEGAAELPSYRAAWVLVHNLTIVAITFGAASSVFVSHLWQEQKFAQVHRLLLRNIRLGWLVMLGSSTVLCFAGKSLFDIWLGPGHFVGLPLLIAFLITETLETQCYIIACATRATGDEAFPFSSLAAGLVKIVLSVNLAARFGLLGVAFGTLFALLVTNHWYVPWRGLTRLRFSKSQFLRDAVLPCVAFTTPAALLVALFQNQVGEGMPRVQLAITVLITALCFVMGLWWLVLERSHRERFWQWCRRTPVET